MRLLKKIDCYFFGHLWNTGTLIFDNPYIGDKKVVYECLKCGKLKRKDLNKDD